jgi:hypothetical protein
MTLNRIWMPSPNYSGRDRRSVRLIVLHTSEGAQSYQSLGSFFGRPAVQVSSHVGIDDTLNTVGEYVKRDNKAWTAGNANPVAVQAELCTPNGAAAGWDYVMWKTHQGMLNNCAAWVAEEAAAFGIPIVKLTPQQAQSTGRGVCQHRDLGSWGSGHSDCGNGFPIDEVIAMAGGQAPPPTPQPTPPPIRGDAPAFPYPPGHYLGQPSNDPNCHSGYYGGVDTTNVATWQTQMAARGWTIVTDGMFGPGSSSVARQFQAEKGLSQDGLVGPQTWRASWTSPVT